MKRNHAVALFATYLAVLFALTLVLFPSPPSPVAVRLKLVPLVGIAHFLRFGGRGLVVNVLGNLAAFIPLGFLLPSLSDRHTSARWVVLVGFCLSLDIEILQFASQRRVADVDDLLLNTLGAFLGYYARGRSRGQWRRPPLTPPD